jgi:hypothetical protein
MKIYILDEAGPSETSDVLTAMLMTIAIVWQILTGVAESFYGGKPKQGNQGNPRTGRE